MLPSFIASICLGLLSGIGNSMLSRKYGIGIWQGFSILMLGFVWGILTILVKGN